MRAVGLDIGTRTVAVVVVGGTAKNPRIEFLSARPLGSDPASHDAAIRSVIRDGGAGHDPSAVAVPVHRVSVRALTLPFTQRTKLEAVLPAELEGQIPFELDEVVIDGMAVPGTDPPSILAAAVPLGTVKACVDDAHRAGLDPRVVTIDAVALAAAAGVWLAGPGAMALIHLDARSLSVSLVEQGRLRGMRGLVWDGDAAEDAVNRSLGIERHEMTGDGGGRGPAIAAALLPLLQPMVDDLRRTLQADARVKGGGVEAVAVSGRWSAVPDVVDGLADALGVPRRAWPSVTVGGVAQPLAPTALAAGLAIVAGGRDEPINFRRGPFAYGRERAGFRRQLMTIALVSVLVVVAGAADLGVRLMTKERRYTDVQDRVRAEFLHALPGTTTVVSEADQLQTAIAALTKRRAFLGGRTTALDVLLALTDAIPKESGIAVSDLVVDHEKVRIEAETTSFDWVNRIETALAKSPAIAGITVSDAKTTADQAKIRFLMTITLKEGV